MILQINSTLLRKYSDVELIQLVQETSDGRFFGELYRRYFSRVHDYCRKIVSDSDTAADIAQNSFIRAFEKINGLRVAQTWVSWIFRISRNECLHYLHVKNRKRTECIDKYQDITDHILDVEAFMLLDNKEKKQLSAIALLPNCHRELLLQKYLDGESIENMKVLYGVGESAIKMRLLRARQQAIKLAATL